MKVCALSVICFASAASAFSTPAAKLHQRGAPLGAVPENNGLSRSAFLTSTCSAVLSSVLLPSAALAEDETASSETKPVRSIRGCEVDEDCISTASIKDAKGSYSPPWTFEVAPDEAFARIKGILKSDDQFVITEVDDDARYIRAYARRIIVDRDEVEFLVRGDDKVVLYRSTARKNGTFGPSPSDFGAQSKRIDDIRKRGAVFDLMGGGMTADSFEGGGAAGRGNSPLGQLKAFYGLQKGGGFESVFEEDDE